MKKVLGILIIFGMLAAAASTDLLVFGAEKAAGIPESSLYTVQRGQLKILINENGYLKAKNSLEIQPKFNGSGTITWLVDEGETVAEGDLLIEFDKNDRETQLSELENKLIQYEIEFDAAQANLQIQERDNLASIETAELKAEMSRLVLERYKQGEAPNKLRKLDLAVEKAESELERARVRFKEVPALVDQGFLTVVEMEEERIRVREAEINDENARADLELHKTYTEKMELTQKESDVKDATRVLENAREKASIHLKERQALVQQKERQVTSTKTRIEKEREQIGYFTVVAEKPGVVHYGDPSRTWMRDRIKIGGNFHKGSTILTIPDLSEMQVLIQVHEADIDLVKKDMEVIVTIETNKGVSFPAKITSVATVASSDNWMDQTNKSFRVEVTLDPYEAELRAGVTAKADILVATLEDVVYIPIHAAYARDGERFCFVYANGKTERRKVEIGKNNTSYVVVAEGLEDGEQVLLYDPSEERNIAEVPGADAEEDDDADGLGSGGMQG